jgi:hypothetical protein
MESTGATFTAVPIAIKRFDTSHFLKFNSVFCSVSESSNTVFEQWESSVTSKTQNFQLSLPLLQLLIASWHSKKMFDSRVHILWKTVKFHKVLVEILKLENMTCR